MSRVFSLLLLLPFLGNDPHSSNMLQESTETRDFIQPGVLPGHAAQSDRGSFSGLQPFDAKQTLWRAKDGLFYVDVIINGATVRMIVDTGASMTVLCPEDARRAGIGPAQAGAMVNAETAAGASDMTLVSLARMQVGRTSARDVSAVVAGKPMAISLLGQNWLSRLGSMTIEGDRMTLR